MTIGLSKHEVSIAFFMVALPSEEDPGQSLKWWNTACGSARGFQIAPRFDHPGFRARNRRVSHIVSDPG